MEVLLCEEATVKFQRNQIVALNSNSVLSKNKIVQYSIQSNSKLSNTNF